MNIRPLAISLAAPLLFPVLAVGASGQSESFSSAASAAAIVVAAAAVSADASGCPPEEEAVLSAYAVCAAFRGDQGEAAAAKKAEGHAAKLRKACGTQTSVFIGVDPYQDLLECAQALALAGRLDEARQVEPVAQTYRREQMLRLVMHGGQTLDPARYLGRPADYERKRKGMSPPEQRFTTPEFSVGQPRGGGWKLVSGQSMPLVFAKDPAWLSRRPAPSQTVVVAVALRDAAPVRDVTSAEFPGALEAMLRSTTAGRFRLVSVAAAHRGEPGDYCADYELALEERDNAAFPGVVLEIRNRGFACLERSSQFLFEAFYSERRPQGAPSVLDDAVRGEAEAFLQDIQVGHRRGTSATDATPNREGGQD